MKHFKPAVAELLGTFALVFFSAGAVLSDQLFEAGLGSLGLAAVSGTVVSCMIYGLGEISGAHINPAVSFAFALSGRFPWKKVPVYIIAQLLGSAMASLSLSALLTETGIAGETRPHTGLWSAFILEAIFTFFLMLVIIAVSTGAKEKGIIAGMAIGLVVFIEVAMGGALTGASMNPARSFGPDLVLMDFNYFYLYLLGPLVGASLAVGAWKIIKPKP